MHWDMKIWKVRKLHSISSFSDQKAIWYFLINVFFQFVSLKYQFADISAYGNSSLIIMARKYLEIQHQHFVIKTFTKIYVLHISKLWIKMKVVMHGQRVRLHTKREGGKGNIDLQSWSRGNINRCCGVRGPKKISTLCDVINGWSLRGIRWNEKPRYLSLMCTEG